MSRSSMYRDTTSVSDAYVAVPTTSNKNDIMLLEEPEEETQQQQNNHHRASWRRASWKSALVVVLTLLTLGFILDADESYGGPSDRGHYLRHHHHHHRGHDHPHDHHHHGRHHDPHHHHDHHGGWWHQIKKTLWGFGFHTMPHHHPTRLPGGGRDWLVDVSQGIIASKHAPDLVLGVDSMSPLVLVDKDAPNQINFGAPPPTGTPPKNVPFGSVVVKPVLKIPGFLVRIAGFSDEQASSATGDDDNGMASAFVTYKDNFIILKADDDNKKEMVLDVAFWEIVEGARVNFVADPWCKKRTFVVGGGRVWVWKEDGTIRPKLNPNLVLGKALPSMVLVEKSDDKHKLVLKDSVTSDLASGKSVPFELKNGGVVGQRFDTPKDSGPWHYVESNVDKTATEDSKSINIQYDGNYIFVNGENLVLDVTFWQMKPGSVVNYVGGDAEKDDEVLTVEEGKAYMRGSSSSSLSSSED